MSYVKFTTTVACAGLALALLIIPPVAEAQRGGGSERHLERMQEDLSLSDEQVEQIREIFELNMENCMDSSDRRSCMRSQRESTREQIDAVLTDEQKTKHAELIESRGQGRGMGGGRGGMRRGGSSW